MMHTLRTTLVVLPLLLLTRPAHGFGGPLPYKVEAGANVYFRVNKYPYANPGAQGPWYLYWPLEAHFQTQAPGVYPTWPQQMGLPPSFNPPCPIPQQFN